MDGKSCNRAKMKELAILCLRWLIFTGSVYDLYIIYDLWSIDCTGFYIISLEISHKINQLVTQILVIEVAH